MKKNMGGIDRIVRIIVASIISILYWQGVIEGVFAYTLFAVAGIFVLTSLISFCPIYTILGLNTCSVKKQ